MLSKLVKLVIFMILTPVLLTMLILVLVAILIIYFGVRYLDSLDRAKEVKRAFEEKQAIYDNILQQYFQYYKNLPVTLREKFLKRTIKFKAIKAFKFIGITREEHMPLLISATAIQLTFGLDRYLMDGLETIYVMEREYNYGLYNTPFEGHVSTEGIYLSWSSFERAYADYSDGDNVGLHEMAHALSITNFTFNTGADWAFKRRFRQFSKTGRAVFANVQSGEVTFLGNYAATNYEEFWAVCVENFFERPLSFKIQLPELYAAMCILLNQDLLTPGIILAPAQDA